MELDSAKTETIGTTCFCVLSQRVCHVITSKTASNSRHLHPRSRSHASGAFCNDLKPTSAQKDHHLTPAQPGKPYNDASRCTPSDAMPTHHPTHASPACRALATSPRRTFRQPTRLAPYTCRAPARRARKRPRARTNPTRRCESARAVHFSAQPSLGHTTRQRSPSPLPAAPYSPQTRPPAAQRHSV